MVHIAEEPNKKINSDLVAQRCKHTGNQWTKFIRTRNEIEHILGLRYNTISHKYEDFLPAIEGLEVIFMRGDILDGGNERGIGNTAYAVYPIILPYQKDKNPSITSDFIEDRYVILKSAIEDYLIHTDDVLHLIGNTNRAYALEFYLSMDSKSQYKMVMQQVNTRMEKYMCAEGNTPIELP
jgi:hypothetical protein